MKSSSGFGTVTRALGHEMLKDASLKVMMRSIQETALIVHPTRHKPVYDTIVRTNMFRSLHFPIDLPFASPLSARHPFDYEG